MTIPDTEPTYIVKVYGYGMSPPAVGPEQVDDSSALEVGVFVWLYESISLTNCVNG